MTQNTKKKILILGAGFGGLYAYRSLYKHFDRDDIEVTIVNKTNYFLFTPLLHEVATGGLSEGSVVESIQHFLAKNGDVIHVADVLSLDPKEKIVTTSLENLPYDILVIALGASTQFFGTPGAEENSLVLKDLNDAVKMRGSIIDAFQKASVLKDASERKKALSFVVVGGGPTGVELVAEMDEFIHNTLTDYYKSSISCDDISITLVNQGPELLSAFPPVLRKKALEILQDKKINVLLNTGVKEVLTNSVLLSDGKNIDSTHTIWTAGVKPNTEIFNGVLDMNKGGRIFVDKNLHIPAFPEIFVIGDVSFVKEDENSAPLPMTAQVAVRQGDHVASNVKAFLDGSELIRFEFESKGEMASLGRFQGLANIFGFSITGPVAWFLWRTVYLFKFISHFKKIKVAFDWTMNLFFSRDITKI
jgi:NADH dehydrogenase